MKPSSGPKSSPTTGVGVDRPASPLLIRYILFDCHDISDLCCLLDCPCWSSFNVCHLDSVVGIVSESSSRIFVFAPNFSSGTSSRQKVADSHKQHLFVNGHQALTATKRNAAALFPSINAKVAGCDALPSGGGDKPSTPISPPAYPNVYESSGTANSGESKVMARGVRTSRAETVWIAGPAFRTGSWRKRGKARRK